MMCLQHLALPHPCGGQAGGHGGLCNPFLRPRADTLQQTCCLGPARRDCTQRLARQQQHNVLILSIGYLQIASSAHQSAIHEQKSMAHDSTNSCQ